MKTEPNIFLDTLYEFHHINAEFPIQYIIFFLELAKEEGRSLTNLAEKTGMSLSTVSRITNALSREQPKRKNYGLITVKIAPDEKRRKQLFLSPKGKTLIQNISKYTDQ